MASSSTGRRLWCDSDNLNEVTMTAQSATRIIEPPDNLNDALKAEFVRNQLSGRVGHVLLSESDRVRVWSIHLKPGERLPFHRHVLDYFWTAITPGQGFSHNHDGSEEPFTLEAGSTRHLPFGLGELLVHDLNNTGDSDLIFTTVEFLDSANNPIELPDEVRREERNRTVA